MKLSSEPNTPEVSYGGSRNNYGQGIGSGPRSSSVLSFGDLLLSLRDDRHLTQAELGKRLSQSTSYVSLLENGRRHPTRKLVMALKAALALSEEEAAQLTAAAGFPADELGQAVHHVVDIILQQAPGETTDRELVQADLTAVAKAWRDLLLGKQQILAGNFYDAEQHFARMGTATELTPTLNASVLFNAADVTEKRGDLTRSDDLAQRAQSMLDPLPEGWAVPLRAEIVAIRGLLEVRLGQYKDALKTMERSLSMYMTLMRSEPSQQAIAAMGLAKAYNRLALVSLMQGQPQQAEKYCDEAEHYLSQVTQSPTDRHRLRLVALRAWAYSKMPGRYADARRLRAQALRAYEELHDPYGIAKQQLFLGDDFRQEIESYLTDDVDNSDPEVRRRRLRELLSPHRDLIDEAEKNYRLAIEGLERAQESIELSRGLRSLSEILRYQDILHPNKSHYREARLRLNHALSMESEIGQGRRIPVTYETLAKLEWDRGALVSATNYYLAALRTLEDSRVSSTDPAGDTLRRRCQVALDVLRAASEEVRLPEIPQGSLVVLKEQPDSHSRWRDACQKMVDLIVDTLMASKRKPAALSDLNPTWLGILKDMETKSGVRLIAQRQLCKTLSTALPPGYPAERAALHAERCQLFARNIADANQRRDVNGYHDLCCRVAVERGVADEFSGVLCKQQVTSALEFLGDYPHGYALDASVYDLPFGFAIKGGSVYLEMPARLVDTSKLAGAEGVARTSLLCYEIEDEPDLLQGLTNGFWELIRITQKSTQRQMDTLNWLRKLAEFGSDEDDPYAQPIAVGAI